MCGRFFRHGVTWEEYHNALNLIHPNGIQPPEPAYNIAPTQYVPIIRMAPEGEDVPRHAIQMAPVGTGSQLVEKAVEREEILDVQCAQRRS